MAWTFGTGNVNILMTSLIVCHGISLWLPGTGAGTLSYGQDNEGHECPNTQRFGPEGNIANQNYPQPYLSNQDCSWFINAEHDNMTITISFREFDLEDKIHCEYDYLEIGPVIGMIGGQRYCGSELPPPFISSRGHVWLKFHTDQQDSGRGFSLMYITGYVPAPRCTFHQFRCNNGKCIPENWTCNGMNECGDGSDESTQHCTSGIHRPNITKCGQHYFSCISIDSKEEICLPEFRKCDGIPDCLDSIDELRCSSTCNHYLDGDTGYFTTPHYPQQYSNHMECTWIIEVPAGNTIQLRFVHFQIDSSDTVIVYDGDNMYEQELCRVNDGQNVPKLIESSHSRLMVVFQADEHFTNRGFNATYQRKGACLNNQTPCEDESNCYDFESEHCNNFFECENGQDEMGCHGCKDDEFSCWTGQACFSQSDHCSGKARCTDGSDEYNCNAEVCNSNRGLFLCKNRKCIFESWQCDETDDCGDGSDEVYCPKFVSSRVITAAVIGSLICGLLLVIALGCTCKLYALRLNEHHSSFDSSPMSRVEREFMRREAPPTYAASIEASDPSEQAQSAFMEQVHALAHARRARRCQRSRLTTLRPTSLVECGEEAEAAEGAESPSNEARQDTDTDTETDRQAAEEIVQESEIARAVASIQQLQEITPAPTLTDPRSSTVVDANDSDDHQTDEVTHREAEDNTSLTSCQSDSDTTCLIPPQDNESNC